MHVQIHNPSEVNCSPPNFSFFKCAGHLVELHAGGFQIPFEGSADSSRLSCCPECPSLHGADTASDGPGCSSDAHAFIDAFDCQIELVGFGPETAVGGVGPTVEIMSAFANCVR